MAEALFLAAPSQQAALEAPAEHSLVLTAAESELRQELSGLLVESGKDGLIASLVSSLTRHCLIHDGAVCPHVELGQALRHHQS